MPERRYGLPRSSARCWCAGRGPGTTSVARLLGEPTRRGHQLGVPAGQVRATDRAGEQDVTGQHGRRAVDLEQIRGRALGVAREVQGLTWSVEAQVEHRHAWRRRAWRGDAGRVDGHRAGPPWRAAARRAGRGSRRDPRADTHRPRARAAGRATRRHSARVPGVVHVTVGGQHRDGRSPVSPRSASTCSATPPPASTTITRPSVDDQDTGRAEQRRLHGPEEHPAAYWRRRSGTVEGACLDCGLPAPASGQDGGDQRWPGNADGRPLAAGTRSGSPTRRPLSARARRVADRPRTVLGVVLRQRSSGSWCGERRCRPRRRHAVRPTGSPRTAPDRHARRPPWATCPRARGHAAPQAVAAS